MHRVQPNYSTIKRNGGTTCITFMNSMVNVPEAKIFSKHSMGLNKIFAHELKNNYIKINF